MMTPSPTSTCQSPPQLAEHILLELQVAKAHYPWQKTLALAVLAGIFIGFGCEISTLAAHDAAHFLGYGPTRILCGSVFSLGLMLVMVAGAELFTGNTMMLASLWLGKVSPWQVLRNWLLVYGGNLLGSLLLAGLVVMATTWQQNEALVGAYALKIAVGKVNLSFGEAFARGILCNLLVCLAVWMSVAARDVVGKLFAIFFPIMAFIALGYEHCIANLFYIPKGMLLMHNSEILAHAAAFHISPAALQHLNLAGFIGNLIPVTLGNIVGGGVFIAGTYAFSFLKKHTP